MRGIDNNGNAYADGASNVSSAYELNVLRNMIEVAYNLGYIHAKEGIDTQSVSRETVAQSIEALERFVSKNIVLGISGNGTKDENATQLYFRLFMTIYDLKIED